MKTRLRIDGLHVDLRGIDPALAEAVIPLLGPALQAELAGDTAAIRSASRVDAGRVTAAGDAHAIAQTVCDAFGMPSMLAPWFAALVGRPRWRFVVAERAGAVVAAGAVFIDGDRAWLGIGATLAQHRKLGAQSTLLAARVALAAQAGCSVLSTETGEAVAGEPNPSLSNIRRAGFEQVCSRTNLAAPKPGVEATRGTQ